MAVLLARAVVESESEQSWRFFLSNLRLAVPAAISGDRDKGWPCKACLLCCKACVN